MTGNRDEDRTALSETEDKALRGLSYLCAVHEDYLIGRLGITRAAIDSLIDRGIARREVYHTDYGVDLSFLCLTVAGAARRHRRTQQLDADPAERGWRNTLEAELTPEVEP